MNSSNIQIQEYIIDKNYINKNTFQDLKELLKAHEKIKIITSPKYVPIAFQVSKELNIQGLSTYDEELKVERDFTNSKRKTNIILTLKRKPKIFEYLIGNDYFYKNIYTEVKSHLNIHNKVTIVAKTGEVGIAFKVVNQLVKEGIAFYDDELKLGRNFKAGKGSTKVFISLKKIDKEINKVNDDNNDVIDAKKNNEEKNGKISENIKELIVEKNFSYDKLVNNIKEKFEKTNRIILIANKDNVGTVFKVINTLSKNNEVIYDDELKVKHEIKNGKGRAKIHISIKKNIN